MTKMRKGCFEIDENSTRSGDLGNHEGSRRRFLLGASATALAAAVPFPRGHPSQIIVPPRGSSSQEADAGFGLQFPSKKAKKLWKERHFNIDRWWGTFSRELPDQMHMFEDNSWSVGPFYKYAGNPVLTPTPGAWDRGAFGDGVHNGSIIVKENRFYYVYRGGRPLENGEKGFRTHICDIGLAVSDDGIHFTRVTKDSGFFRKGPDKKYSYEDVNVSLYDGTYYLFCNQWAWEQHEGPSVSGDFLATSKDLLHWEKRGIVFPHARQIHRNGVVVQNPHNEAVRINGKFVMYLDNGLIAYSTDMIHWESDLVPKIWPGGEVCFALTDYNPKKPDDILLFTGGHHTGHWYAVGEVLYSKANPGKPLRWLPRSPLFAEPQYPFEAGFTSSKPYELVSDKPDCIFFNGLTEHQGKWWLYYGAADYYTCLANSPANRSV